MKPKQEVAEIRQLIKARVPTVSVRMGTGTARSWIEVSGSLRWGEFTPQEREGLKDCNLGLGIPGANYYLISPDERLRVLELLRGTQGH